MRAYKIALAVTLALSLAGFFLGPVNVAFSGIGIIVGFGFSALLYIAPIVAANSNGHPQAGAITLLTILLGWTFLGWVAALVWANTTPAAQPSEPAYQPQPAVDPAPMRKCPQCAEMIKREAIKCRFCHSDLSAA